MERNRMSRNVNAGLYWKSSDFLRVTVQGSNSPNATGQRRKKVTEKNMSTEKSTLSLFHTAAALGRHRFLQRLHHCLAHWDLRSSVTSSGKQTGSPPQEAVVNSQQIISYAYFSLENSKLTIFTSSLFSSFKWSRVPTPDLPPCRSTTSIPSPQPQLCPPLLLHFSLGESFAFLPL